MKKLSVLLATCALVLCAEQSTASPASPQVQNGAEETVPEKKIILNVKAGHYLSGRFAQSNHDWRHANQFMQSLLEEGITTDKIEQRAMILAMGSGNTEDAIRIAKQIKSQNKNPPSTIAEIFLIADAFKHEKYAEAASLFKILPDDATMRFIGPYLRGWIKASNGTLDIQYLRDNTMQLYHAILISDFLNNHTDIENMIDTALKVEDIRVDEIERIADLYGHVGLKDKAINLYKIVLDNVPENTNITSITDKISHLENNTNKPLFKKVTSARRGLAKAFHDLANVLYSEKNEESARVFAHVALYLDPGNIKTTLLLAEISTQHKQYKEAIAYYDSIPSTEKEYMRAQHRIVDIYQDTERYQKALNLLQKLSHQYKDIETLIKIGNLQRHQEQYHSAIKTYEAAKEKLGGTIPKDYWHLHYVRGMAYEQNDNWPRAEEELKAALAFQPDHPYILNYLGYAWADKGIHLEKSLQMIKRAVDLRPSDGYITNSLGWVMYRTKDYKNAVPILERAVELLPYDPTINDHLGDAYWKVGRQLEAKFQWKRAKNHSEDDEQVKEIEQKLASGLNHDTAK